MCIIVGFDGYFWTLYFVYFYFTVLKMIMNLSSAGIALDSDMNAALWLQLCCSGFVKRTVTLTLYNIHVPLSLQIHNADVHFDTRKLVLLIPCIIES